MGHRARRLAQELRGVVCAARRRAIWSISGVSGGEHGANGFVAAHDQETGKEVWRFWTVPQAAASRAPRRGRARTSSTAARRPGSPAATTPSSTSSTGRPAIPARSTTATIARATTSTRAASWRSIAQDRHAEVALPVHAARPVGLGRDADLGARRRRPGRASRAADAARQPQRLLLRVRSRRRQAAAGEAVRQAT